MIFTLIKNINTDATVNDRDVNEWVECREENEFTFKTYEEIIKSVTKVSSNGEEKEERQVEEQKTVMQEEAVCHFNHDFKWVTEDERNAGAKNPALTTSEGRSSK